MAWNQDIIKILTEQPTTVTGTVDPTSVTPEFIGQVYIRTDNSTVWVAKSVAVGDWIDVTAGGGGAIDIQKDDVSVVDPCTALNFEGSGVASIVDEGGGKATVTIEGGVGSGIVGGDQYVDRGDPSVYDFTSFTTNAAWHELDLSSIVPVEAAGKLVHIGMQLQTPTAGAGMYLREVGQVNFTDISRGVCPVANVSMDYTDFWVKCNNDRKIEYFFSNVTWTKSNLVVRGWEKQTTIDTLVRGDEYVDRGDSSLYDYDATAFTKDSSWHDLDLSSILPIEAANQLIHIKIVANNTTAGANFKLKTKGNSNDVNEIRWVAPNTSSFPVSDGWVRCDANRTIQYWAQNIGTWSSLYMYVRGWMKTSDGGAIAGVKYVDRGDPAAWDFTSGSFTKDSAYHDLDLSSILPSEAANQLVHLVVQVNTTIAGSGIYFRKKGLTNGYNVGGVNSAENAKLHTEDIWVRCNESRVVQYFVTTGYTWTNLDVLVRGWWQPIDKGQAIQPTYGAPVVHMEYKDADTITVKAGRYFVDGGWYELESDLDWTWSTSGQNFGTDDGSGESDGWWYLYMFLYGDRPAVVASKTAPTAAYNTDLSGLTYDKNIYLGAFSNDSGSVLEFYQSGREFFYAAAQGLITTTSSSWQTKTIAVPYSADQVVGLINCQNSGSTTPSNAYYSPNASALYIGPRNDENTTGGHYDQFIAPVVTPQTGYLRNGTNNANNVAQMWTLGWKDRWIQ